MNMPATVNGRHNPSRILNAVANVLGASTTVTASVVGTTETVLDTIAIPGNLVQAGGELTLFYALRITSSGIGSPTLRYRLRLGGLAGTVIGDTGAISQGTAITDASASINGSIYSRAAGSLWPFLRIERPSGALASTGVSQSFGDSGTLGTGQTAAIAKDMVPALDLVLTMEYSANTAGNSITVDNHSAYYIPGG